MCTILCRTMITLRTTMRVMKVAVMMRMTTWMLMVTTSNLMSPAAHRLKFNQQQALLSTYWKPLHIFDVLPVTIRANDRLQKYFEGH